MEQKTTSSKMRGWLSFCALALMLLVSSCRKSGDKILETIPRDALAIHIDGKGLLKKSLESALVKEGLEKNTSNVRDSLALLDDVVDLTNTLCAVGLKAGNPEIYFTAPLKDAKKVKSLISSPMRETEVNNGDLSCFHGNSYFLVMNDDQAWLYLDINNTMNADEALAYIRGLQSLEKDKQLANVPHVADLIKGDVGLYYPSSIFKQVYAEQGKELYQQMMKSPILEELWSQESYGLVKLNFEKQDFRLQASFYGLDGKAIQWGDVEVREVALKEAAAFFQPKQVVFGAFNLNPSITKFMGNFFDLLVEADATTTLALSVLKGLLSKIDGTIAFGLGAGNGLLTGNKNNVEAALLIPVEEKYQSEFISQLQALLSASGDGDLASENLAVKALNDSYISVSPASYVVEKRSPSYNKSKYASLLEGSYGGVVLDLSTGSPISMMAGILGIPLDGYVLLRSTDQNHSELVWHNEAITEGNTLSFLIDKVYGIAGGYLRKSFSLPLTTHKD